MLILPKLWLKDQPIQSNQVENISTEDAADKDSEDADEFSAVVHFIGGDQDEPVPGLEVTAVIFHDKMQDGFLVKTKEEYGPFTTDEDGKTKVSLPSTKTGFCRLYLDAAEATPWLGWSVKLDVTNDDIDEKSNKKTWPPVTFEDGERIITVHLRRACEVVLRAVDADTGEGIAGAEFYKEAASREMWANEIWGQNIGFKKPVLTKDRRTNSEGIFRRLLGPDSGWTYMVWTNPPGYESVKPIRSSGEIQLNISEGQAKAEHTFKFKRISEFIWSKKDRDGLLSGAKLLSATGKLEPGDPVVVQFVLKNVSDKEQTVVLQASDSAAVMGANNRLQLNVTGNSQNTFQHTLKPGEILQNRRYRVLVDTTGMTAGNYNITSGSAFWLVKKDDPNFANGIPFRREIPFTLGDPNSVKQWQPPADENPETKIYWGKPTGDLILGMRLPQGRQNWPDDGTDIEGQLFLFNAGDDEIELTCELPANPANWNINVTSRDDKKSVKLDSTWFTGREPQRTRTIRIPENGQVAITGIRAEVTTDGKTAVEMIKGPNIRILKEKTKFEYGAPKRMINQQGKFNLNAALTIRRSGIADIAIVASSSTVPFEISSKPSAVDPEPKLK